MTRRRTTNAGEILKKHTQDTQPAVGLEMISEPYTSHMKAWKDLFSEQHYMEMSNIVSHFTSMDTSKLDFSRLRPPTQNVDGDLLLDMSGSESVEGAEFFVPSAHSWMKDFIGKLTIQEVLADIQVRVKSGYCFPGFRELKNVVQNGSAHIPPTANMSEILFPCALVSDSEETWQVGACFWFRKTEKFHLSLAPINALYQGQAIAIIPRRVFMPSV